MSVSGTPFQEIGTHFAGADRQMVHRFFLSDDHDADRLLMFRVTAYYPCARRYDLQRLVGLYALAESTLSRSTLLVVWNCYPMSDAPAKGRTKGIFAGRFRYRRADQIDCHVPLTASMI